MLRRRPGPDSGVALGSNAGDIAGVGPIGGGRELHVGWRMLPCPSHVTAPHSQNLFDLVPSEWAAVPLTAPDHLALTSLLAGGPRPRGKAFRALEIGCAEGANFLALAAHHPDSYFVGLDRSEAQIAIGRAAAAEVG